MAAPIDPNTIYMSSIQAGGFDDPVMYGFGFSQFYDGTDYDSDTASTAFASFRTFIEGQTPPVSKVILLQQVTHNLDDARSTLIYGTTRDFGWDAITSQLQDIGLINPAA